MKTVKLIIGVFAVLAAIAVILLALHFELFNEPSHWQPAAAAVLIFVCLLTGGLVIIDTRRGGKAGPLISAGCFGLAAVSGIALGFSRPFLLLAAAYALIAALVCALSLVNPGPSVDTILQEYKRSTSNH